MRLVRVVRAGGSSDARGSGAPKSESRSGNTSSSQLKSSSESDPPLFFRAMRRSIRLKCQRQQPPIATNFPSPTASGRKHCLTHADKSHRPATRHPHVAESVYRSAITGNRPPAKNLHDRCERGRVSMAPPEPVAPFHNVARHQTIPSDQIPTPTPVRNTRRDRRGQPARNPTTRIRSETPPTNQATAKETNRHGNDNRVASRCGRCIIATTPPRSTSTHSHLARSPANTFDAFRTASNSTPSDRRSARSIATAPRRPLTDRPTPTPLVLARWRRPDRAPIHRQRTHLPPSPDASSGIARYSIGSIANDHSRNRPTTISAAHWKTGLANEAPHQIARDLRRQDGFSTDCRRRTAATMNHGRQTRDRLPVRSQLLRHKSPQCKDWQITLDLPTNLLPRGFGFSDSQTLLAARHFGNPQKGNPKKRGVPPCGIRLAWHRPSNPPLAACSATNSGSKGNSRMRDSYPSHRPCQL